MNDPLSIVSSWKGCFDGVSGAEISTREIGFFVFFKPMSLVDIVMKVVNRYAHLCCDCPL